MKINTGPKLEHQYNQNLVCLSHTIEIPSSCVLRVAKNMREVTRQRQ